MAGTRDILCFGAAHKNFSSERTAIVLFVRRGFLKALGEIRLCFMAFPGEAVGRHGSESYDVVGTDDNLSIPEYHLMRTSRLESCRKRRT